MSSTSRMADFGYLLCGLLLWAAAIFSVVAERHPATVRRNPLNADQEKPAPHDGAGFPCAPGGRILSRS